MYFQCTADGPAGQPGEDVPSRAAVGSSVVIARAQIRNPRYLGTTVSETPTKTGYAQRRVAQVLTYSFNIFERLAIKY